jgi:hypothetical protein
VRFDMRDFRGSGPKAAIRKGTRERDQRTENAMARRGARQRGRIDTSASPPLSTQRPRATSVLFKGAPNETSMSPAPTDPDAHEVCACLAHLHRRRRSDFHLNAQTGSPSRLPTPGAAQIRLVHTRLARPGPKRGDLSCDPNWIHPSSPRPPVDLEPALNDPPFTENHLRSRALTNSFCAPILSPAAQPE